MRAAGATNHHPVASGVELLRRLSREGNTAPPRAASSPERDADGAPYRPHAAEGAYTRLYGGVNKLMHVCVCVCVPPGFDWACLPTLPSTDSQISFPPQLRRPTSESLPDPLSASSAPPTSQAVCRPCDGAGLCHGVTPRERGISSCVKSQLVIAASSRPRL